MTSMQSAQQTGVVNHEKSAFDTSGVTDPVWIHTEPYSNRPQFDALKSDIECDVCIIGSGITGVSTAYELVKRGHQVVLVEARGILSGETGRTSGHLASDLDDGYTEIANKHGKEGAKMAYESHQWALNHVGEVAKELGIDCEYRHLPGYDVSQYPQSDPKHEDDVKMLRDEVSFADTLGMEAHFKQGFAVKGWDGAIDQRDAAVFPNQATFHPTKYVIGLLKWLEKQPNFSCYTHTRVMGFQEKGMKVLGIGSKSVKMDTESGNTISAKFALQATNIPLQKLAVIAQEEYLRTYCIAVKIPKGYMEDCLLYDSADPYIYVRLTKCDDEHDYMVVGGGDHAVGQEEPTGRFEHLEKWVRDRFTKAGSVDYKWSGQVMEPVDYMAYIGSNQGQDNIFIMTGDSGNGLTHGVIASKLISDQIEGKSNPWTSLYNPSRKASMVKALPDMLKHDVQVNMQYKRFGETDIKDIEDLPNGEGGVLNTASAATSGEKMGPVAVYKDDGGKVFTMDAKCPHLKGVVCWNRVEKSWDCPIHGSRFSAKGLCVQGPAKGNMTPIEI